MVQYKEVGDNYEINGKQLSYFFYKSAEIKVKLLGTYLIVHETYKSHEIKIKHNEVDAVKEIFKQVKKRKKEIEVEREQFRLEQEEKLRIDNLKKTTFSLAGTSFKQKEIKKLLSDLESDGVLDDEKFGGYTNKEILDDSYLDDNRIFEYEPIEIPVVILEKEPNNEYDSKAIKVMAGSDEETLYHVGYIPSKKLKKAHEVIDNLENTRAVILGGRFKTVDEVGEKVIVRSVDYKIDLTLKEK